MAGLASFRAVSTYDHCQRGQHPSTGGRLLETSIIVSMEVIRREWAKVTSSSEYWYLPIPRNTRPEASNVRNFGHNTARELVPEHCPTQHY